MNTSATIKALHSLTDEARSLEFLLWLNKSKWAGADENAVELARSAWNEAVSECYDVFCYHERTIKGMSVSDAKILAAAINNVIQAK